ncbi:MAG: hypothetical protein FJ252_02220 [Phycisphaerae bacterium]|nr:hypothetical protein [Phycisphaerae bacterium]
MDLIERIVRRCQGRYAVQAWARAFLWALLVASGLPIVWVAVAKIVGDRWDAAGDPQWMALASVAALVGAGIAALVMRDNTPSPVAMASVIDAQLDLKDRLSTALAVRDRQDPFAQAAVQDAMHLANERGLVHLWRRALPFTLPRLWWGGPSALALAWLLFMVVPAWSTAQADASATDPGSASRVEDMKARLEAVVKTVTDDPRLSEEMAAEIRRANEALDGQDDKSLAEKERELAKRLTEMAQKLESLKESAQAKGMEQTKDALAKLEVPKNSAVAPLTEALKQGDIAAAKEAMKDLQQKMKDGSMTDAEREQAKKDLEALAKKLQEMAKDKDALRKSLEDAGLDPNMADSPEALKRAIEQSKQLNEAQKEQLKQALDAAQQMQQNMQQLSNACKQCQNPGQSGQKGQQGQKGQKGQKGEQGKEGEQGSQDQPSDGEQGESDEAKDAAAGEASELLNDMEAQEQMDQAGQCAGGQCKGGDGPAKLAQGGQSEGLDGDSSGSGMGKRGQGSGGQAPREVTKTNTVKRREKVEKGQGPIIARQLVEGPAITGEAATALQSVAGDVTRKAESATAEDPVPPHLKDSHRRYFGDVKKQIDRKTGGQGSAAGQPAGAAPSQGGTK